MPFKDKEAYNKYMQQYRKKHDINSYMHDYRQRKKAERLKNAELLEQQRLQIEQITASFRGQMPSLEAEKDQEIARLQNDIIQLKRDLNDLNNELYFEQRKRELAERKLLLQRVLLTPPQVKG